MVTHYETDPKGTRQAENPLSDMDNLDEKAIGGPSSGHDEYSIDLKKVETKATLAVDMKNRDAIKGDDSDGRVDWTFKQIVATVSLSGLYVGEQINAMVLRVSLRDAHIAS